VTDSVSGEPTFAVRCSTPGSFCTCASISRTKASVRASDQPGGVLIVSSMSPRSSSGTNEVPTRRPRNGIEAMVSTAAATTSQRCRIDQRSMAS